MGLVNPQGSFHAYGSSAGGAGPNILIAQTRVPKTNIPNDLGNEVQLRDFILTSSAVSRDTRAVLEVADDNGSGAPGAWAEKACLRTPDYGNAMRSYTGLIKIKQNQWFRVRTTQVTVGAHEVEMTGETAAQDLNV